MLEANDSTRTPRPRRRHYPHLRHACPLGWRGAPSDGQGVDHDDADSGFDAGGDVTPPVFATRRSAPAARAGPRFQYHASLGSSAVKHGRRGPLRQSKETGAYRPAYLLWTGRWWLPRAQQVRPLGSSCITSTSLMLPACACALATAEEDTVRVWGGFGKHDSAMRLHELVSPSAPEVTRSVCCPQLENEESCRHWQFTGPSMSDAASITASGASATPASQCPQTNPVLVTGPSMSDAASITASGASATPASQCPQTNLVLASFGFDQEAYALAASAERANLIQVLAEYLGPVVPFMAQSNPIYDELLRISGKESK